MHKIPDIEVKIALLVTTDTRDESSDESGKIIEMSARNRGYEVIAKVFCKNNVEMIRKKVKELAKNADAVIVTGGTGISKKDVSVDAIKPMFDKELPGFGEIFRAESYEQIGHFALSSRACAGVIGNTLIFCIPGSVNAAKTAIGIILPALKHLVYEVKYK